MKIRVKEIMDRRPRTVNSDTSMDDLLKCFRGRVGDCFPVVDKERKLVGVVTGSDILEIFKVPSRHAFVGVSGAREARKGAANHVRGIMTWHPIVATPDMTVEEVVKIMTTHKLRHLPVVRRDKLVGLITLRHLINLLSRD